MCTPPHAPRTLKCPLRYYEPQAGGCRRNCRSRDGGGGKTSTSTIINLYVYAYPHAPRPPSVPFGISGHFPVPPPPPSGSCPFLPHHPKKPTSVAAPSPRASLGRRTVCGRTEQLRPPVSKRYETKVRMVWASFVIAAAALKTPTKNGYNAQGVNLTVCLFPSPPLASVPS